MCNGTQKPERKLIRMFNTCNVADGFEVKIAEVLVFPDELLHFYETERQTRHVVLGERYYSLCAHVNTPLVYIRNSGRICMGGSTRMLTWSAC